MQVLKPSEIENCLLNDSFFDFEKMALSVFQYQCKSNPIYKKYIELLGKDPSKVQSIQDIPFLPISLFKNQEVKCGDFSPEVIFSSSGTSGNTTSRHAVKNLDFYLANTVNGFEHFYGSIEDYSVFALLPAYLERKGSSLVAMADHFIKRSKDESSGFFLYDHEALMIALRQAIKADKKILLIGVSFALLDLAEAFPEDLSGCVIMETGGMKGRKKEMTRTALHQAFQAAFSLGEIHSEYGMTELLSQAYSKGKGIFECSPTMKVFTREITDPLSLQAYNKSGGINIIDLANIHSCSFLATDDLGRVFEDGSFEILGRFDNADIRGCNLMVGEL